MPTLVLRFPGGRYHATPAGHHVNEGIVEWPPSPWRLLRALIACGYATEGWKEPPAAARRLVESLASALPSYRLPSASVAHTRHYMPLGVFDKGREKTTLVFDTWAQVGSEPVVIHWPCQLDGAAEQLLIRLASNLGYLGRSESWVTADVVPDDEYAADNLNSFPHVEGRRPGKEWEQITLMAPEPPEAYAQWRQQATSDVSATDKPAKGRKSKKKEGDREAAYPVDLLQCLQTDTAWWKQHRWSQPPGSRRVLYWRPVNALSVGTPIRRRSRSPDPVTTMLLALTTPSGARSALPPLARVLPQGELLHRALVARAGRGERVTCQELVGKDEHGVPLTGHRHAHFLPLDLDGDNRIDHFIIYAPMGLGAQAQAAIRGLKRTWTRGGVGDLQLALVGQGDVTDLRQLSAPLGSGIRAVLAPTAGSRLWVSVTPLVLPRYVKRRGPNTVEGQILAELKSRGLPPAQVEVLPWDTGTRHLRHFKRSRRHPAKPPPMDMGLAVRLTFAEPQHGPICLGYGAHFGLGMMVAVGEVEAERC